MSGTLAILGGALLLLVAVTLVLAPAMLGYRSYWFNALTLFGATAFVWSFVKYVYIGLSGQIEGVPGWATAADYSNSIAATLGFSLVAAATYIVGRGLFPIARLVPMNDRPQVFALNLQRLGTIALVTTIPCLVAFLLLFTVSGISITGDSLATKRFLDSSLGPQARLASLDYWLLKVTLLARAPLYLLAFGLILTRERARRWWIYGAAVNFFIIMITAIIFSNRANLFLAAVDIAAMATIFGRKVFTPKTLLLAGVIFSAIILVSTLRSASGGERDVLEHVFEGRYFVDIERTDQILDFYETEQLLGGSTFISWIGLFTGDASSGAQFMNMGWELGYKIWGYQSSGVPPGYIGELFMNFGYLGILGGAMLFGAVAAGLSRKSLICQQNPVVSVIVCLVSVRLGLFLFNNNLGTAVIKIMLEVMPFAVLVAMCASRIGPHPAENSPIARQTQPSTP